MQISSVDDWLFINFWEFVFALDEKEQNVTFQYLLKAYLPIAKDALFQVHC